MRQARYKQPKSYLEHMQAGNAIQEEAEIARDELGFEFMLNALRLTQGIEVNLFAERTGLALNTIERTLIQAEAKRFLFRDHKMIKPTELGQRFLNDLQQMLLND